MAKKNWIPVNIDSLHTNERRVEQGVEINIGLSPYDIPEAIRSYFDKTRQKFIIELKYMDGDEQRISRSHSDNIEFAVGEHSGCLYEILVDPKKLNAPSLEIKLRFPEVSDEILRMAKDKRFADKRRHYEVVREALSNSEDLLATE